MVKAMVRTMAVPMVPVAFVYAQLAGEKSRI